MSAVPNLLAPPAGAPAGEVAGLPPVDEVPAPLAPGSGRAQQPAQPEAADEGNISSHGNDVQEGNGAGMAPVPVMAAD